MSPYAIRNLTEGIIYVDKEADLEKEKTIAAKKLQEIKRKKSMKKLELRRKTLETIEEEDNQLRDDIKIRKNASSHFYDDDEDEDDRDNHRSAKLYGKMHSDSLHKTIEVPSC